MNCPLVRLPVLLLVAAALTAPRATADEPAPYASAGFLKFPADVEVGAVSAVAIGAKDEVYVLQRGEPPLLAFDAQGNFLRGFGQGLFKTPHGLRLDREGNLWTTDNALHVLRRFSPEGKPLGVLGMEGKAGGGESGFRSPDDLVFDKAGNFYVADAGNGRIVKLSPEGKFLAQWGKKGKAAGEFATAHSLAIDGEDRIYVGDRGNKRIQVFDTAGKLLHNWNEIGGNAFGLLVVGEEVLATEGDQHYIFHVGSQGQVVRRWGDPKLLLLPHLLAQNSKRELYVAEVNGKRIQIFRPVATTPATPKK